MVVMTPVSSEKARLAVQQALLSAPTAELRRVLSFAAACAAVTCGRVGADPPWLGDLTRKKNELLRGA
jgi:fructokinase